MPSPLVLPVAEYRPDLPDYPGQGSAVVTNVYPKTPISYGPIGEPSSQYGPLATRCRGGAAYRDSNGDTFIFAGDAADLYLVKAGLATWLNVSLVAGGYSAGEQLWQFAYFNGDVVATDFVDAPQVFTLIGGAAFADLPGTPPKGKYVAVVKNTFLAFGNTWDSTNGNMPQRVWWSAAGNHRDWPILGTDDAAQKQSGAVDLLGPGGAVQGFAADLIAAEAVVFQEFAVRRMTYAGPPTTFSFLPVEAARGCLAPGSIVVNGGIAYYWGQDGIYAFDGSASKPIGANKVDKTVYADVDMWNLKRIAGAADPVTKTVWWAYPSHSASDGNPDRLLCYNWELDRWSLAEVTCETLLRLLSIGYSLDELETVLGYMTVDVIPHPLSSDVWLGGKPHLAIFNTDHKLCYFTGSPLAVTVDTPELQPAAGRRLLVRGARPLVDGATTTPSVAIGYRERQQDAVSWSDAVALNAMGACPVRRSGRYVRARITLPAGDGDTNSDWNDLSGVELDAVAQGTR